MKRLLGYIFKDKKSLVISIISSIISVASSILAPIIIGKAIDNMLGEGNVNFNNIIKIIILLVVVYALGSLFNWVLTYLTNAMSYKVANLIRSELLQKINKLPLSFFDNRPHGDIISRFVNDVDSITEGMLQGINFLLTGVITIIGVTGFMIYINPIMAIVVLVSAPFTYLAAKLITRSSQKYFNVQVRKIGELNGYIEEIISGQKTVKSFGYEEDSIKRFKSINKELYKVCVKSEFFGSLSNPSTRLINNIAYGAVGIAGGIIALKGNISVGDISTFLIYSSLFSKPFNEITGVLTQIQSAIASSERIFEILELEEEKRLESKNTLIDVKGNLSFQNVNFSYSKDRELIKNFNLNVKKGSRVAIVGKTGCGKTTLVNLIMRFYDISSGKITIDGVDTKSIQVDKLRREFGMVLQDTFLFTDTIANNISYGKKNATKDEIISVAKKVGAHSFIRRLSNGYDTVISSEGESLSTGQKQLLTIARVMLIDPPMLILDEATSNIDIRTEIKVQKAFETIMNGRTSFIIAHRLSTIKDADVILVMDNGNVVEQGSHSELLLKEGFYYNLWSSGKSIEV